MRIARSCSCSAALNAGQPGVELLERAGIAFHVVAMPVLLVEIDQIDVDQALGFRIHRLERLGHAVGIVFRLDVPADAAARNTAAIDAEKLTAIVAALLMAARPKRRSAARSVSNAVHSIDSLARIGWSAGVKVRGHTSDTTTATNRTPLAALFDPPTDRRELVRHYTLSEADITMISTPAWRSQPTRLRAHVLLSALSRPPFTSQ